jgi:hypothetical protein
MVPADPQTTTFCQQVTLRSKNIDIDYIRQRSRSADVLAENGFLRAGKRAYFGLLDVDEQPSYSKCTSGIGERRFWLAFAELPGRTLCVYSDEGRVGVIQAEDANSQGTVIDARLTVWDKA